MKSDWEKFIVWFVIISSIFHFETAQAQTTVAEVSFTYDSTEFGLFQTFPLITQPDAQTQCINWGGDLTTIKSDVEDSLLLYSSPDLNTIFTCHIGLNRIGGHDFVWIDGSTSSYRNWGTLDKDFPLTTVNFDCVRNRYINGGLSQGWLNDPCTTTRNCYFCSKPGTSNGCDFTYEGSCYKVFTVSTPINWLDAQSSCAIWGGDLTSITTERENNYLNTLITSSVGNCWIGLNDREVEGTYTWIDGTTVSYTNWTGTPPNAANSDCVQINNAGNGIWESVSCDITLNAFLCKRDSSSAIPTVFGRITDEAYGFEALTGNIFFYEPLTLVCGSDGSPVAWRYSQYSDLSGASVLPETSNYVDFSWLYVNNTMQGYYQCMISNAISYTVGVYDATFITVAVTGTSYTYIVGVDRTDVLLLCDPEDGGSLSMLRWTLQNGMEFLNPINLNSESSNLHDVSTSFSCKRGGDTLNTTQICVKVPTISISYGVVPVTSYSSVYPAVNALSVPSAVQDITLSINIEGKWNLPDDTESSNSVLTIPTFSSQENGVYKFYIHNWDGVEVCAIQVTLTTTTTMIVRVDSFTNPSLQVNFTVNSPVSQLYYPSSAITQASVSDSDIQWTNDVVKSGDDKVYTLEYPNPADLNTVFSDAGGGLQTFSCFYRMSPVTLLGSVQLALKDTATITVSYQGSSMTFSDVDNPIFPSAQEISIIMGTTDVMLTCSLSECVWILSDPASVITIQTYTIPEITDSYNVNISLMRRTSTGTSYTTAHVRIYAQVLTTIQPQSNSALIAVVIIVLVLIIILAAIAILILLFICFYLKKRNTTKHPKTSVFTKDGSPGYENLSELRSPSKEYLELPANSNPQYMTIDETSMIPLESMDEQKLLKYENVPNESAYPNLYEQICGTSMNSNVESNPTVPNERYVPMSSMKEEKKFVSKYIPTKEFPATYQQYVASGIEKDSLFSVEFTNLTEDPKINVELDTDEALKVENFTKNPLKNIVPFDENRVVLHSQYFNCNYINASYIYENQFIATIHPNKATHRDFLQLIYQTEASMVVMLTTRREKAKIIGGVSNRVCYWPKNDESIDCEPFVTTLINSIETTAFVKQEISLKNTLEGKEHTFTQCISPTWNEDSTVAEMSLTVVLLSRILKHLQDDASKSIIIHCEDGISKTGIILAGINSVKELTLKKTINIFNTVKNLRRQRMKMVPTLACYTTCYSLMNEYCSIHL